MTEAVLNESANQSYAVEGEVLYPTSSMVQRAKEAIERCEPDVLLFVAGSNTFSEQTVLFSIRQRYPGLYRPASRVMGFGRSLGGPGAFEAGAARGLVFRLPRAAGRRIFGTAPLIEPAEAFAATRSFFDYLASLKHLRVACTLATGNHQQSDQSEAVAQRTSEYNDLVAAECTRHGYPVLDVHQAFAERGWPYVIGPDRLHETPESRRHFAELLAELLSQAVTAGAAPAE